MSDVEMPDTPPRKKLKKRYSSKFQTRCVESYPWVKATSSSRRAFCKLCNSDFSVEHGGKNNSSKHANSDKHKAAVKGLKRTLVLDTFISRESEADLVIAAETRMAMFIAKNNVAMAFSDNFSKSVALMFPDSNIAKKYSSGRVKTTQIIKGAIALDLNEDVNKVCQTQPFALLVDESNNIKQDKGMVILARVYSEAEMKVVTRFLDTPVCNIGNAENLFEKLSTSLRERNISWDKLMAFNSDNASVMEGKHNSLISRLRTSQPNIQDLGCICHLIQLATGCGVKTLPLPVEDFLVGIYYHFDKSAKRSEIYKEFVEFTDSDSLKLLRYCSTRRLSLLTCINRVLNQWTALRAYFESHDEVETNSKIRTLASHLCNPEMKAYFLFLSVALKPLAEFNTAFQQSEGVMIHKLGREMAKLVKRILGAQNIDCGDS